MFPLVISEDQITVAAWIRANGQLDRVERLMPDERRSLPEDETLVTFEVAAQHFVTWHGASVDPDQMTFERASALPSRSCERCLVPVLDEAQPTILVSGDACRLPETVEAAAYTNQGGIVSQVPIADGLIEQAREELRVGLAGECAFPKTPAFSALEGRTNLRSLPGEPFPWDAFSVLPDGRVLAVSERQQYLISRDGTIEARGGPLPVVGPIVGVAGFANGFVVASKDAAERSGKVAFQWLGFDLVPKSLPAVLPLGTNAVNAVEAVPDSARAALGLSVDKQAILIRALAAGNASHDLILCSVTSNEITDCERVELDRPFELPLIAEVSPEGVVFALQLDGVVLTSIKRAGVWRVASASTPAPLAATWTDRGILGCSDKRAVFWVDALRWSNSNEPLRVLTQSLDKTPGFCGITSLPSPVITYARGGTYALSLGDDIQVTPMDRLPGYPETYRLAPKSGQLGLIAGNCGELYAVTSSEARLLIPGGHCARGLVRTGDETFIGWVDSDQVEFELTAEATDLREIGRRPSDVAAGSVLSAIATDEDRILRLTFEAGAYRLDTATREGELLDRVELPASKYAYVVDAGHGYHAVVIADYDGTIWLHKPSGSEQLLIDWKTGTDEPCLIQSGDASGGVVWVASDCGVARIVMGFGPTRTDIVTTKEQVSTIQASQVGGIRSLTPDSALVSVSDSMALISQSRARFDVRFEPASGHALRWSGGPDALLGFSSQLGINDLFVYGDSRPERIADADEALALPNRRFIVRAQGRLLIVDVDAP